MENHLTRPEIQSGHDRSGVGRDMPRFPDHRTTRPITTLVLLPSGEILRVAQDARDGLVYLRFDAMPAIVLSCVALMLAAAALHGRRCSTSSLVSSRC